MPIKFYLATVGFLFLSCCSSPRSENKDVLQLREELPQIQLPIVFNSDRKAKHKAIDIEGNEIIKRIIGQNAFSLLGKLFETESNITILGYCNGSPIVITLDNDGHQTSSLVLYDTAKIGAGHHTSSIAQILSNRHIVLTDSTVIKNEILGHDSTCVSHKKCLIAENGTIETLK